MHDSCNKPHNHYHNFNIIGASPTLITHTRKSLYLCMYVCMYVSVYVAIRRPRAHHAIAHV